MVRPVNSETDYERKIWLKFSCCAMCDLVPFTMNDDGVLPNLFE